MHRPRGLVALVVAAASSAALLLPGAAAVGASAADNRSDRREDRPSVSEPDPPLVIGHRGASGYRPEHTLEAYRLAIELGADYIEPDLVATKDHVLVARHENEISQTTDVADRPEFADRRTTKAIDGLEVTGWFTEDFTLAELKTLRAKERIPDLRPRNTVYDGRETIPTLEEILTLVAEESARTGRRIGIAPETKHPTYFDGLGLSMEEPLVAALHEAGLRGRKAPVFLQSFEVGNLRDLDRMTRLPIVQLIGGTGAPCDLVAAGRDVTYIDMITEDGLERIARYADAIGPDKSRIVPRDAQGALLEPTALVQDAHDADLLVIPYTFRNENAFLPKNFQRGDAGTPQFPSLYGDAFAEYELFYGLGVDALFTDNPDVAVDARKDFLEADSAQVQLLSLNDFHGALEPPTGSGGTVTVDDASVEAGGAAYFATHVAQQRAENPNTLSISSGDLLGGSPLLSALFHDEPTVEAMNQLGLGIATVGNHEFDEGVDELMRMTDGGCHPQDGCFGDDEYAGSTSTWLAANVVDRPSGKPILEPYEIRQYGGVRIGVIGVVLDETPTIVSAEGVRGVKFLDEVETIDR